MASATISKHGEYDVTVSDREPEMNAPQKMGVKMWKPMLAMAVMAFPIALILGAVLANLLATGTTIQDTANAAALGQYTTAVMFIGFTAVFSAIVFAIGRILGNLRTGGGSVQEASGRRVLTLAMPMTAKGMLATMMMAMMMLLFAVVAHVVLGFVVNDAVQDGDLRTIASVESWATWIEGLRRVGAAVYLVSISLGLATIIQVLRFQSARIRELPGEQAKS